MSELPGVTIIFPVKNTAPPSLVERRRGLYLVANADDELLGKPSRRRNVKKQAALAYCCSLTCPDNHRRR